MNIMYKLLLISFACVLNSAEVNIEKYFKNCDQVLNNGVFKSCYNYSYKSTTASYIELTDRSNQTSIKERFAFYDDKNIPVQYRASSSDYTNRGRDRGHIQSDASNDYYKEVLYLTYAMSNITMQYPQTNRRSYLEVEKHERKLVHEYGNIRALTVIKYSNESINGIGIPLDYTKIFWNDNFIECYNIKNDNKIYTLEQMRINCSVLNINK